MATNGRLLPHAPLNPHRQPHSPAAEILAGASGLRLAGFTKKPDDVCREMAPHSNLRSHPHRHGRIALRLFQERDYFLVEHIRCFTHGEMAGILHCPEFKVEIILRDKVGPVDDDAGISLSP